MTELVRPLRAMAEVALGRQRSPEHEQGPFMTRYLRAANVKDGALDLGDVKEMNFTPREREVFSLRPGDVLVSEGAGSLSAVGAAAVWDGELPGPICFQNTLLRLRPRHGTDARFLAWWCRYAYSSGVFSSVASGANIFHLSAERIRGIRAWVPDRGKQGKIADFLDAETARIDALIEKKWRMIELLHERLRAMVMKELFGVRAHWVRLGRMVDLLPGFAFSSELFSADGAGGVRLLRGINVAPGRVRWEETVHLDASLAGDFGRYSLAPGDLVIGMDRPIIGGGMRIAEITETDVPSLLVQRVARIRVNELADRDWIRLALMAPAFVAYFSPIVTGVSVPHISPGQIQDFKVPLPQRQAQETILQRLLAFELQSGKLCRAISDQIALLREHGQALITAAVTGQLEIVSRASTRSRSSARSP